MSDSNCSKSCDCSADGGLVMALACSGASNVGQIANAAAVELNKQGKARFYCLIGVAAHIPGMVDSAQSASEAIAIDGCPVACAKIALEHAGIPVTRHIIVTELGIQKNHVFEWSDKQVEMVFNAATVAVPV